MASEAACCADTSRPLVETWGQSLAAERAYHLYQLFGKVFGRKNTVGLTGVQVEEVGVRAPSCVRVGSSHVADRRGELRRGRAGVVGGIHISLHLGGGGIGPSAGKGETGVVS